MQDGAQNMEQNGRQNAKFAPKWTHFDILNCMKMIKYHIYELKVALGITT